jgi:biotin carboxyl carrier protein
MHGTVLSVADTGSVIGAGRPVVVLESMKMQHDVTCDRAVAVV